MSLDFFKAALTEAQKSSYRIPMGAVVVVKNKVVGAGHNIVHSTGMVGESQHAEISAINDTPAKLRPGSVVIVGRTNKSNELAMAKPCASCETVLRKLGVKAVWYSDVDGWKKIYLQSKLQE